MPRFILPALLTAVFAPALAYAATADGLQPGKYRITTTGHGGATITEDCIDADKAARMLAAPPAGANCRTLRRNVANGRIDIASSCAGGAASVTGTYAPTGFRLTSHVDARMGSTPINFTLSSRGQRIAATCRADD